MLLGIILDAIRVSAAILFILPFIFEREILHEYCQNVGYWGTKLLDPWLWFQPLSEFVQDSPLNKFLPAYLSLYEGSLLYLNEQGYSFLKYMALSYLNITFLFFFVSFMCRNCGKCRKSKNTHKETLKFRLVDRNKSEDNEDDEEGEDNEEGGEDEMREIISIIKIPKRRNSKDKVWDENERHDKDEDSNYEDKGHDENEDSSYEDEGSDENEDSSYEDEGSDEEGSSDDSMIIQRT